MTGCSVATSPNGQWSLMIRRWSLRPSACAAKPCAVNASATAWIAERSDRWPAASSSPVSPAAIARPYSAPTSSAICSASSCGKAGQRPSEQRQDEIVAAHREVGERAGGGGVALRRPPGAATGETAGRDLEVPAGGELVEVVAGDVGVDADLGGDHRRGDPVVAHVIADVQVDPAARRIAERIGDGRHGGGERRADWPRSDSTPRSLLIRPVARAQWRHVSHARADRRCAPSRRGP